MLSLAVQSIAKGLGETVVDVLRGKAFALYSEGLKQYLVLRLGSLDVALDALSEVRAMAGAQGMERLASEPGIRARLYAMARSVSHKHRPSGFAQRHDELPYMEPASDLNGTQDRRFKDGKHADSVHALRSRLSADHAEILELHHARELNEEEISHVYQQPVERIHRTLQDARDQAARIIEEQVGAIAVTNQPEAVNGALLEAFALDLDDVDDDPELESVHLAVQSGTVVADRYEIESRAGSGAFADVYRAKDTEVPGHVVALKLLHQPSLSEESRQAALRELHLIASVFHPSVVQFKDHGWHEGRLWFVMPWYEGETLEDRIQRKPLSREEARRIFVPLANALATMHAVGIRHQDVKPENIFLARIQGSGYQDDILPVLLDLGVAAKEAEMVVAGTPNYFAPEVAAQFARTDIKYPVTQKADVFALALSLKNALDPDDEEDVVGGAVETFIAHRASFVPTAPAKKRFRFLKPYFDRWMHHNPETRPDADQIAKELEVLTEPEEKRARRHKLLRWLIPTLVTLAATFSMIVYVLTREAQLHQLEATRARNEVRSVRHDLNLESERREALESDVQSLQGKYKSSRLSRLELATQLGATEAKLKSTEKWSRSLWDRLGVARNQANELTNNLQRAEQNLSQVRQELSSTENQLDRTRLDLSAQRQVSEQLRDTLTDRESELSQAERDLDAQRQARRDAEREVASLKQELIAKNSEIAEIKNDLRKARNRPTTPPENAPEPPSDDPM